MLEFYAQSTGAVISGRSGMQAEEGYPTNLARLHSLSRTPDQFNPGINNARLTAEEKLQTWHE